MRKFWGGEEKRRGGIRRHENMGMIKKLGKNSQLCFFTEVRSMFLMFC
jgi:hypothetical protein